VKKGQRGKKTRRAYSKTLVITWKIVPFGWSRSRKRPTQGRENRGPQPNPLRKTTHDDFQGALLEKIIRKPSGGPLEGKSKNFTSMSGIPGKSVLQCYKKRKGNYFGERRVIKAMASGYVVLRGRVWRLLRKEVEKDAGHRGEKKRISL